MPRRKPDLEYVGKLKDGERKHRAQRLPITCGVCCFFSLTLHIFMALGQDFYNAYLTEGNYRVDRFHDLARAIGISSNMVATALEKKKARSRLWMHVQCTYGVNFLIPIYAYMCARTSSTSFTRKISFASGSLHFLLCERRIEGSCFQSIGCLAPQS